MTPVGSLVSLFSNNLFYYAAVYIQNFVSGKKTSLDDKFNAYAKVKREQNAPEDIHNLRVDSLEL